MSFAPWYSPKRINVTKDRDLNRQDNFCGGEDVTDLGEKNSDIHVSGRLLKSELSSFKNSLGSSETFDLTTEGFNGEVRVGGGEYEGPIGKDAETREFFFSYSLDLVSTGKDE
ncbi:hypothetical protein [Halonotius roseus]|uniref:Uncharacterized protein n=1 Tax=Halonotius roseus TaxID=2511997 RepID=A0A544QQY0_9EURY|nr:hypothetical protein [Halonotius roseus]TQQ81847.1 hypothetical protein EWF95_02615 [Halonotius roseus]